MAEESFGEAFDALVPGLAGALELVKAEFPDLQVGESVAVVCPDAVVLVGLDLNEDGERKLSIKIEGNVLHHAGAIFAEAADD